MKKIYFKEEYCMACRLCEISCLVEHSQSKKIIKAYREEFPKALPRLIVEHKGKAASFALQCRHCTDAPCLEACVSGAMHRDAEGRVLCDQEKCAGCWMCIMVCPFGVIRRDRKEKKVATKCDLCPDRATPVCVAACPNEALVYGV